MNPETPTLTPAEINQKVEVPEVKPKDNHWITIASMAVFVLLSLSAVVFLYYQNQQLKKMLASYQNSTMVTPSSGTNEAPATVTGKILLSDALSKFCTNNKIALDKLPFTLSQTFKSTYKVQNSIDCFVPDESYASVSIVVHTPDFNGDNRDVYFFHSGSVWQGQGNNFQSLDNYKAITVNGQNLWLNVRSPDPYGISTLGVWVDLINEKKDASTGTIVRAMDLEILKDQDILDLVKKYGVKQSDPTSPEYIISDPTKEAQFIDEIAKLASTHSAFKKPAQNVVTDLNGVSFN